MTPEQIEQERQAFEKWLIASGLIATNHEFSIACKWFKEAKRYKSDLISGLFNVWLSRALQPAWISVEDKLPENSACYLGAHEVPFADGLGIGIYYFDAENKVFRMNPNGIIITIVTHWQPLPEPPKAA